MAYLAGTVTKTTVTKATVTKTTAKLANALIACILAAHCRISGGSPIILTEVFHVFLITSRIIMGQRQIKLSVLKSVKAYGVVDVYFHAFNKIPRADN
jgi:hypothetical protein